ncbi:MAG TPA: DUF2334 domain-containing protein [Fibrobacteria bacterium]|nr:DUF2334 domain-containing protein [Fibrobacteria bacterium]
MEERYATNKVRIRLHDVSPLTWDACLEWIELCASLGLPPIDLFVIPRHEGGPASRGAGLPEDFVRRLRELHGKGHPLWIHGWTHRGEDSEREFLGMEAVEAADRARRALLDWRQAKLPEPTGFCPPCWIFPMAALPSVFQMGYKVVDLRFGEATPGRMLRSAAISTWGGNGLWARTWNRTLPLQKRLLGPVPTRIALHPQDLQGRGRRSMEKVLASLI